MFKMGKFKPVLLMFVLVAASFLALLAGAAGSSEGVEPTRAGIENPFNAAIYFTYLSDPYYPGEHEGLYGYVYSDYDGSAFEGSLSPGNETEVKEVKFSYVGMFHEDSGDPATAQILWTQSGFYNNDGDGYTIDRYWDQYFYTDASNNYLEFDIKTDDARPGEYVMRFQVSFRYMINWDGATQYDWVTRTITVDADLEIRSYLGANGWPDYTFYALDQYYNNENLYSGAANEKFGLLSVYSASGTLTDIQATLAFPGLSIMVRNPVLNFESIVSTIVWNIDVPQNFLPGTYEVQLQLEYTRSGTAITEAPMLYEFTVEYTPLLMPPEFDDLSTPFATYHQKTLPTSIDVPFINVGNVDLYDIVVSLDTSNTRYVSNGQYWFDENNNANVNFDNLEFSLGDVAVGGTGTATFSMVNFMPRLPPGLYKIPIDYYALYYDDGTTGNTPGEKISGYWNEMGYYEHRNIMRDIEFPETGDEHMPYLLIEILDDPEGPDITGYIDSGYNVPPGTVNNRMRLMIENHEMYYFFNLEYRIHIDDGSPFNLPYAHDNYTGETLPPVYRGGVSETSGTGISTDSFYFYANIREDAMPGINYFKVDVEGVNEWDAPFNHTFWAYITLTAHQPRFQELNVQVGEVMEDRSVEVTVEIQNMGRGGARNMSCYFDYSSNGYTSIDPAAYIGTVGPGATFFYTFHFRPEGSRRYLDGGYSGTVYFSYYDDMGQFTDLYAGTNMNLRFDVYEKLPDIRVIDVNAPLLDRNKEYNVKVTVMNMGGTTAEGLKVMLPYDSNQFRIIQNMEVDVGDLEPGEQYELEYRFSVQDEVSDGTTYSFTLYFSYTDVQGRMREYSDAQTDSFSLRIKDRIIPYTEQVVVKDDGQYISQGLGSFLLGIMILVAVIVFVKMTEGKSKVEIKNVREAPKEDVKRSKELDMEEKPKVEFDEDDDEEEEEEEEEESEEEEDDMWK
ncbi:MAG: hypothetical protein ACMUIE_10560 [Thermoplasmatota archaeon]